MTAIKATFGHADYSDVQLGESIGDLLSAIELAALASIDGAEAHVATISFAFARDLTLYFISAAADVHSKNFAEKTSAAVALWATPEKWSDDLYGIQIYGRCEELKVGAEFLSSMRLYLARFPAFNALLKSPSEFKAGVHARMYAVRPERLRLVDERRFGHRTFIDAKVAN
jgi:uncharacterized protein YhbP (UPF0306 family)